MLVIIFEQNFESRKGEKWAPKMNPFGGGAALHRPTPPDHIHVINLLEVSPGNCLAG